MNFKLSDKRFEDYDRWEYKEEDVKEFFKLEELCLLSCIDKNGNVDVEMFIEGRNKLLGEELLQEKGE